MNDLEQGAAAVDPQVPQNYSSDELEASCAKIWTVYISEAEKYDKALVESWRGNMDGMLIFAGLFSASLTAFIIESYKTLTPDPGDTMAALLKQISGQLAASASGTTFEVPAPTAFVAPVSSVVCNILWFTSLGFSLACALVATLVEQWARDFIQRADMRPSPVIRARIFSYLYYGLKRFNMHLVVEIVPLLLHTSLVLFFAGLVTFLLPIHPAVMGVSATLLGIIVVMYCYLTILPLVSFDSPYRTPFSSVLWQISQFWQSMTSHLWVAWVGRQKQSGERTGKTLVEGMIHRAVQPSAQRNDRDLRALTWTMKSLVDHTELEPFIAGIPDMLWGPKGRRFKHDYLIWTLVENPDTRLGDRLLQLDEYSDSGLLAPPVQLKNKISCLSTLWAIGTLSKRGAPLNLPSQLLPPMDWKMGTRLGSEEVSSYLPAAEASLKWSLLCGFDLLWGTLESNIQTCLASSAASPTFDLRPVQNVLHRMVQDNLNFVNLPQVYGFNLFNGEAAQHLADMNPSNPSDAVSWLADVQSFADARGTFWDNARHIILIDFLTDCINTSEDSKTLFKFQPMLDMCLMSLPPPLAPLLYSYFRLLAQITNCDSQKNDSGLTDNARLVAVILSMIYPLASIELSLAMEVADDFISYFNIAINSSSQAAIFSVVLDSQQSSFSHLWDALFYYLDSGCPKRNNAQKTLIVMCHVYYWLWKQWLPQGSLELDNPLSLGSKELLIFESLPACPPLTSMLALTKTRIMASLLSQPPLALTESGLAVPPTQTDWDECKSHLSHPLLLAENLEVSLTNTEFNFEQCKNAEEKAAQFRGLHMQLYTRVHNTVALLYTEFIEACSCPTPPYYAAETLLQMTQAQSPDISHTHPRTQKRLADSILSFMQARHTSPEHTQIWNVAVQLNILWPFSDAEATATLNTGSYDRSAALVLKDMLRELNLDTLLPWVRERVRKLNVFLLKG